MKKHYTVYSVFLTSLFCLLFIGAGRAQSFNATNLVDAEILKPTSLDFGPNGKLYVAQQDGTIKEYSILRDDADPGQGTYTAVDTKTIDIVRNEVPNHNDDGTINTENVRQITGLLAAGTATVPVLYVSSSDSRIGGGGSGNDKNLDTNSGVLSRLTYNGTTWDKVDLVRGLPRCEENHSTNGMEIFERNGNTYLLLQQGGNANKGAPSNNFAGTPETFLSGAMLIIDLTQLEEIEAANGGPFVDTRQGNTKFIYDLPTLNDPSRPDIDNTDPEFPYPVGHPMYNATIDKGDPFGGNNGLNQAFHEEGGPVQIFSPGWRNGYDVMITADGRVYSVDNGPNKTWGGLPVIYTADGQRKGDESTTVYDPDNGDYITNELNESGHLGHGDPLHYVGQVTDANGSYYAGHPVPIRAFPSRAGLKVYEFDGKNWIIEEEYNLGELLTGVSGYYNPAFDLSDFPDDPIQGAYLSNVDDDPRMRILDIVNSSTNGICEYTASNFDGAMKGNILTASHNGKINRYILNESGDGLNGKNNNFLSGFGSIPLDVIAQGDLDLFPGTIWVANYQSNSISVFEPTDFGNCVEPSDPEYDGTADYDYDRYTNDDELANGTDICSGGSKPTDNDGDFISDLNDPDDDNDGIPDVNDPFAIDASNGLATNLPVEYPFWSNDPGTGFFGLGFTGLMLPLDGTTDYLDQFDGDNLSFGGAGGKATIDLVDQGDALTNTQNNGFQFGVNVDTNSPPFTVHSKIETPFANVSSTENNSYGIFIGNGDQDHYLKLALMDGTLPDDGVLGFEVVREDGTSTVYSQKYDVVGLQGASAAYVYISVDPQANTAQPYYSVDGGENVYPLGEPVALPAALLDPNDDQGMAVGLIATSNGGTPFTATWDYINVKVDGNTELALSDSPIDFGTLYTGSGQVQLVPTLENGGGPASGAIEITDVRITGANADLFDYNVELPLILGPGANKTIQLNFFPDNVEGVKTANLEFVHSGENSPYIVPLVSTLEVKIEPSYEVVARVNAGGPAVPATDGELDWEANAASGAVTGDKYSVNTGSIPSAENTFLYENRHISVPSYIDEATFNAIYSKERYDSSSGADMEFKFPVENGDYIVNIYTGNGYGPANHIGDRIFDIFIESELKGDDIDVVALFGGGGTDFYAGMLSYEVSVSDGELNVLFGHTGVENPVLQGIEVLKVIEGSAPVTLVPIEDQFSFVDDHIDLAVSASGGDANQNFTYAIAGQPDGINIEPTNGHIYGTIASSALTGGTNNDGIHTVTVKVSKPGSVSKSTVFTWTVDNRYWTDKDEDGNYTARHECSLVQAGDKFYLMGGRENAKTIDVYDYASDTWTQISNSSPEEFNHFQAVEYQGLIWVIGAFKTNSFPNEAPAEYIWAFDPANEEWIKGPEIPENRRRGSTGLVVYNDKFYISGGNTDGHDGGYVNWFDQYDPATGQWTVLDDAPRARDHFHAAVLENKMYLVGGRLSGGDEGVFKPTVAEVDVYDFSTGTWSTLPSDQNIPTPRAAAAVAGFNGKLIVAGGEVEDQEVYGEVTSGALAVTEEYDPESQSWSRLPDLNHARHGTQAIVSGNGVYVLAGSPVKGGGNQKNMEYYGVDAPVGEAIAASALSVPDIVDFEVGKTGHVNLQVTDGNNGIFIRSMKLSGDDSSHYTITSTETENILLKANSLYELAIALDESGADTHAILTIEYGAGSAVDIVLKNGEYNAGIVDPGTQYNAEGESVNLQLVAENMGSNLTFSAEGLPPGLEIDEATGLISGIIGSGDSDGAFIEDNGLVVIEAESGTLTPGWTETTTGGAVGIIATNDSFNSQSKGTIPYQIQITNPGVYRFNWRSFYSGDSSTDENDSWLRFPNNENVWFFGYKGTPADEASLIANLTGEQENVVFPKGSSRVTSETTPEGSGSNGYFKIWRSGGTSETYDWQAKTSDEDAHNVYVWFVNPGTYTMEISERSAGHTIDKMALYKLDGTSYSDGQLTALGESERSGGTTQGAADNSPYSVVVTAQNTGISSSVEFQWVVDNSGNPFAVVGADPLSGSAPLTVNFTGSRSADDVGIVDYSWEFGDALSSTSDEADPSFTFTQPGTYTVLLRVTDGDGKTDSDTVEISVTPAVEYTISVVSAANGTISPSGDVKVVEGESQVFLITPDLGYAIQNVLVDGVSQGALESYTFNEVSEDHTIEAVFVEIPNSITATAGDGGSISPEGALFFDGGEDQVFTATADEGYEFDYFIVDNQFIVHEPSYLFEDITGKHSIKAVFTEVEKPSYLIIASAGYGGTITPIGENLVVESESLSFSVTASAGYEFDYFEVDGEVVKDITEYTFENVTEPHTIKAVFKEKSDRDTYTITVTYSEGGTVDPNGTITVDKGEDQVIGISPDDGFRIARILVDNEEVDIVQEYTFAHVGSDHTMEVVFERSNSAPTAVALADIVSGYAPLLVNFNGEDSTDDSGIVSYTWDFGDGSDPVNGALASHTYNQPGSYTVTLSVEDGEGEIGQDSLTITVSNSPDIDEDEFRLFPNPASVRVTIGFGAPVRLETISIFDMGSNLVLYIENPGTSASSTYEVEVAGLSAGMYIMRTKDVDGKEINERLLIRH
ncbi:PKD domain-containing protein [Pseudozobellia thermophila]|uniref:PKD repeat-containing protein n=1 Tax=Pseudozobellia thermophila TaxID=192903 RepID=A0A1M6FYD0_9FLAO|nr:PKD domain-containing protein [Pseudozobellia thermophila]SHJ02657.1 PKD repeat-containing protein [Pseudozobellia thermophila]